MASFPLLVRIAWHGIAYHGIARLAYYEGLLDDMVQWCSVCDGDDLVHLD